jgi:hypothetical protein
LIDPGRSSEARSTSSDNSPPAEYRPEEWETGLQQAREQRLKLQRLKASRRLPMPNEQNLTALVQTLRGAPGLPTGVPLEALASHLAEQGVLVPAALTDDQAMAIATEASVYEPTDRTEIALCVRQGLEQIAKGQR